VPPTGNNTQTVQQYYDYLYNIYLNSLHQRYQIMWSGVLWVLFWLAVLAGLFFVWVKWGRGEKPADVYPVETYNGYISEANGDSGRFLIVFYIILITWLIVQTALDLTRGQLY
jgi:hypothetical protein